MNEQTPFWLSAISTTIEGMPAMLRSVFIPPAAPIARSIFEKRTGISAQCLCTVTLSSVESKSLILS